MSLPICVDASFVVKLVVPEPNSEKADGLWATWLDADIEIAAPDLLPYEVASAIRKQVHRGLMTLDAVAAALDRVLGPGRRMALVPPDDLHARAWDLASQYSRPNLYDGYYVALAESLGCRLWTARRSFAAGHARRGRGDRIAD